MKTLYITTASIRDYLIQLPLFDSFTEHELQIMAKHSQVKELNMQETLFNEGDQGTFLVVVLAGVIEILKVGQSGHETTLARLAKGSSLGEMSLIDSATRSATARAVTDTRLLRLSKEDFEKIADKNPALGLKFMRKIARLMSLNMRRTSSRLIDSLNAQAEASSSSSS